MTSHIAGNLLLLVALASAADHAAQAQFDLEDSHTTASLRGIHSVGDGVAWASGTDGTVLRTEDGGYLWQGCAIPPGAEKLDFRGIQAFDRNTAIVMSSGKGDLSRLYKTTDACLTWRLVFTNPDKEGFWDALVAGDAKNMTVLGDPVRGSFVLLDTTDGGQHWKRGNTRPSTPDEGAFAASNSSLLVDGENGIAAFGTGAPSGPRIFYECDPCTKARSIYWAAYPMVIFPSGKSAGVFALARRDWKGWIAVGGDYSKPEEHVRTAAYSADQGITWHPAQTQPHGYRSSVAYEPAHKAWITVGPNGSDISTDDGHNWRPLKPAANQPPGSNPDTDKSWNALSLPFVVGPHGRIGKLRSDAFTIGLKP